MPYVPAVAPLVGRRAAARVPVVTFVALVVSVVADAARPVIRLAGSVPPSWSTSPVKAGADGSIKLLARMRGAASPASRTRLQLSRNPRVKSRVPRGARSTNPSRVSLVRTYACTTPPSWMYMPAPALLPLAPPLLRVNCASPMATAVPGEPSVIVPAPPPTRTLAPPPQPMLRLEVCSSQPISMAVPAAALVIRAACRLRLLRVKACEPTTAIPPSLPLCRRIL